MWVLETLLQASGGTVLLVSAVTVEVLKFWGLPQGDHASNYTNASIKAREVLVILCTRVYSLHNVPVKQSTCFYNNASTYAPLLIFDMKLDNRYRDERIFRLCRTCGCALSISASSSFELIVWQAS
jgi:hypothetical protein